MKNKISAFLALLLFAIPVCLCLNACKPKTTNFDGWVADISNYQSLGIGTLTNDSQVRSFSNTFDSEMVAHAESGEKIVLTGFDANGNIEEVKYSKNGKILKPKSGVIAFNQSERYIFVTYSTINFETIDKSIFRNDKESQTYMIDKQTGLTFKLDFSYSMTVGIYGYGIDGGDCGDTVIIFAEQKYYKAGVENGKLKVQEFFNSSAMPGYCSILLADKYGNSIVQRTIEANSGSIYYYVLTNSGELKKIEEKIVTVQDSNYNLYRGKDGLIYLNNYVQYANDEPFTSTKVLNQNGDFELLPEVKTPHVFQSEALIYSNETSDFYFMNDALPENVGIHWKYDDKMVKVNRGSGDEYTFEIIDINTIITNGSNNYTYSNFGFYTIKDDYKIWKYNFNTGETSIVELPSQSIISTIEFYDINKIKFSGTDQFLNNMSGTIDQEGNIEYNVTKAKFSCYYISPIKR